MTDTKKGLITRQEALVLGLKHYFTGKSCPRGHVTNRFVSTHACCECVIQKAKERLPAWRDKNPDKIKSWRKEWRTSNPDKFKIIVDKSRNKHREKYNAKDRERYAVDPEVRRAKTAKWQKEHPEAVRLKNSKRRARLIGATGIYSTSDINRILDDQHSTCLCGYHFIDNYTIDHRVPLSRGGSNDPSNLQLLCHPCNSSKGAKTMNEWEPFRGDL